MGDGTDGATYDPFSGVSDSTSTDSSLSISGGNTDSGSGDNGTSGWFDTNSYDYSAPPSPDSGGDTTGYNADTGTYDWGNTSNDATIQQGLAASAAYNASPAGNDTNPDYGTGVPYDQWTPSQQVAYFNSPEFSNISQAGAYYFGPQGSGWDALGGTSGGTVYYSPTTGTTSSTPSPGSVPINTGPASPITGQPANGTVPIMNTQYEVAKLQAASQAAQLAYDYWHSISGNDQLAFNKAQLAAQTAYQQGQLANAQANTGVEALKLAASLSGNPFRQQQVLWGVGQNPYLSNAVGAVAGQYDLPKFGAPNGSAADSATLSDLAGRIGGTSNGTPGDMQAAVNALPNPNQVVARNFVQMDPATQAYILSGLQAKTGLDTNTLQSEIQGTLPQFKSPSFGLADV